jgi:hypothetical protein
MGTLSLRLSESIHRKLAEVTEHEGISIDQVVDLAIAEKTEGCTWRLARLEARRCCGSPGSQRCSARTQSNSNPEADHQDIATPKGTVTLRRRPGSLVPWIRYLRDRRRPEEQRGASKREQLPTEAAPRPLRPRRASASPAMIALQRGLQLGSAANNPSTNPI